MFIYHELICSPFLQMAVVSTNVTIICAIENVSRNIPLAEK